MNSLRSALTAAEASHKSPDIRAKENIRYELTQPQNLFTSTGLLMEGQRAFPGLDELETRVGGDYALFEDPQQPKLCNCQPYIRTLRFS
jgi:hypothetical protein